MKVPIVIVGNISVGGNGKTPFVLYLIDLCQQLGLSPGVISRGYGGNAEQYPFSLTTETTAKQAGDEPAMIFRRTKIPVVVGPERVKSAQQLVEQGCNIIISDDGMQHYALARDAEFAIVDAKRQFGNGFLLPAGPLREPVSRLKSTNMVILNGDGKLSVATDSARMQLTPKGFYQLTTGNFLSVDDFVRHYAKVNALAGIGDPSRFFSSLNKLGLEVVRQKALVDHHQFVQQDIQAFEQQLPLVMTEKDAVKCIDFADDNCWYLAVDANFSEQDAQQIKAQLAKLVVNRPATVVG